MEQKNMTALISAFSRAYHSKNYGYKIFDDFLAEKILTEKEYNEIFKSMSNGISFFNPEFCGNKEEALRWIVDNKLSPLPLARAAFAESALKTAISVGASQYVVLGAGYDTFAYRKPSFSKNIQIFDLDKTEVLDDKKARLRKSIADFPTNLSYIGVDFNDKYWINELLKCTSFCKDKITFVSMLGLSYYLEHNKFNEIINSLSNVLPSGSSIVFDYPVVNKEFQKENSSLQAKLAKEAGEPMCDNYTYKEIVLMLSKNNFLIYEHLTPKNINNNFFEQYNIFNPNNKIIFNDSTNFCLAVKHN